MRVIWDPQKAAENLRQHGVRFAEAALVIDDPLALIIEDTTYAEQRFVALGATPSGTILARFIHKIAVSLCKPLF